jgi:hypothetical protein
VLEGGDIKKETNVKRVRPPFLLRNHTHILVNSQ